MKPATTLILMSALALTISSASHAGEARRNGTVVEYNDGWFIDNNSNTWNEVTAGFNDQGHFIIQDVNDTVRPGIGCSRINNNTVDCGNGTVSRIKMDLSGGNDIVNPRVATSQIPMEIYGGDGNDILNGANGQDILKGGNGNDTINGSQNSDTLYGEGGTDTINGGAGIDTIWGGNDNDTLNGGPNNDTIRGELGNDSINGGTGFDSMYGDFGADRFVANDGVTGEIVDCGLDIDLDRVGTTVLEDNYVNCTIQEITTP